MADSRTVIVERAGVELESYEESSDSTDVLLVQGLKTTTSDLTLEDSTNGEVTLSETLVDEKVKVSGADTTANFLESKLVEGVGVTITKLTDSFGEETLEIASSGGVSSDLASVVVGNSTSTAMPTSWANITWNTTHLENDTSVIEHDNTNIDRIQIKETGLYFLQFSASFDADSGEEQIDLRVLIDDTTVIPGSLRTASEDDEINDLSNAITAELTAGTYLTLQHQASGTGNVLHSTTTFAVTRARGATGAQGPAGSGSSITVKDEGTSVPNTPHTSLNFIGAGVVVTDAGSGQADITISSVGGEFFSAENLATGSTNSTTPIERVSLLVTGLASGNSYIVVWSYQWRYTDTGQDFIARVQLDNTTDLMNHQQEPKDNGTNQRFPVSGFAIVTGLSGSHTFDLDYRSSNSGDTSFIYNARLAFWRVA
jgi:hypothetical protein